MSYLMTPEDVKKVCDEAVAKALKEKAERVRALRVTLDHREVTRRYREGWMDAGAAVLAILDPETE